MDPCPFVRILVGNLALKVPAGMKPSLDSTTPCYCKVKFNNFATQKSTVPLLQDQQNQTTSSNTNLAACFTLTKPQIEKLANSSKGKSLKVEIYSSNVSGCVLGGGGKLLGSVVFPLVDVKKAESRAVVIHNGWIDIGEKIPKMEVFLSVRVEPDPRYVFEFGGEPECSPQVFQVQGSVRQAVFTCKFSLRSSGDRNLGSRPSMSETGSSRNWLPSLGGDKDQQLPKERKGWSITIHDLSGSPVAMASMVTPFVPSPGSDHVSRSNPGGWLILRPSSGTWKPWGRLEAWRERRNTLGYRFELLHDTILASPAMTTLVNSVISTIDGGKFVIDRTNNVTTPTTSPHSSWDFGSNSGGSGSWSGSEAASGMSPFLYKGFVMSSTVKGDRECSKPEVEIGVQHVNCTEDAAAFVALAAAVDLSMDACKLFSHKLRKELRHLSQSFVV